MVPADEPGRRTACRLVDGDRSPCGQRLGLALGGHRRELGVLDRTLRRTVGRLADDDLTDRGRLLEPERGDDDVARRHSLPRVGTGAQVDERLAGVDRDPDLQVEVLLVVQLADRAADRERRQHGALRVVAVRDRSPEQGHHRVADVLLDVPAEALELRPHPAEVRRLDAPQILGIEAGRDAGEVDEVDEQDGDDPALLASGRVRGRQQRAARPAQPGLGRVVLPAVGTRGHVRSVRRCCRNRLGPVGAAGPAAGQRVVRGHARLAGPTARRRRLPALRERPQSSEQRDGDDDQQDEAAKEQVDRVCLRENEGAIP